MFGEAEHRANLASLVELASMVVFSKDNKCGPRAIDAFGPEIPDTTRSKLHLLAQHIRGTGEWVFGDRTEDLDDAPMASGRIDAMDFPAIAFHVAAGADEQDRNIMGRIILNNPSRFGLWLNGPGVEYGTTPEDVFTAWAGEVRSLAIRLLAADPRDVTAPERRPWHPD